MPARRRSPGKISAVISDVDGTLVTSDKHLTEPSRRAVAALRAHGVAFAIVSSRPPRGMSYLIENLEITTVVAGFNGGVIATPQLRALEQHLLPTELARQAVAMLATRGVEVWVFSGRGWFLRDGAGAHVSREIKTVGFEPTIVDDFGPTLDRAAKIVGVSDDFALLTRRQADLSTGLSGPANVVRSQPYYLDVTHSLANKAAAVLAMAKRLAAPPEEIAVIGDGPNDVAMFGVGGLSIAMGNADPQVQDAADVVTAGNDDDGFAKAIERYILSGDRDY